MILESVLRTGDVEPVDLEVEDGHIVGVATSRSQRKPRRALTGFVDLHTHLREPGTRGETIASGTRAAAAGGYTDVFAMPNSDPCPDEPETYQAIGDLARGAAARVHFVSAATRGRAGAEVVDVAALAAAGAVLFSDDGACVNNALLVEDLLTRCAETGTVFAQHAQSASVGHGVIDDSVADRLGAVGWPREGEFEVVARDIELARSTGGRLHVCHVSTVESVDLVRAAKARGIEVTAEVTPHHLVLHAEDAVIHGPRFKVNPPLRAPADSRALRRALRAGDIDVVATDHAPHPSETKDRDWPSAAFGLTGLETALGVVIDVFTARGQIDWAGVERVMSTTARRIGRLPASALTVGEPATLVLVDAASSRVDPEKHLSASANSPFAGRQENFAVVATMIDGRVTFERARTDVT